MNDNPEGSSSFASGSLEDLTKAPDSFEQQHAVQHPGELTEAQKEEQQAYENQIAQREGREPRILYQKKEETQQMPTINEDEDYETKPTNQEPAPLRRRVIGGDQAPSMRHRVFGGDQAPSIKKRAGV